MGEDAMLLLAADEDLNNAIVCGPDIGDAPTIISLVSAEAVQ
jgi:hypothetical protein